MRDYFDPETEALFHLGDLIRLRFAHAETPRTFVVMTAEQCGIVRAIRDVPTQRLPTIDEPVAVV